MQKAEAISRFTGTMTHDFRNILSVIDAGVRLILRHTEEELTVKRANAIGEAVERGNRLINQLLSFVRGDGAQVTALDLTALIGGADDLLERSLGDGIAFTWHVDEDARYATGNADQIELALLNLAINARDAMDGSGEFSIVATRADDMCEIRACDNGPGVPSALRGRIFETFYSTKGTGKGTGLGLAQVAGAARQAGGKVALREREGGGACFVICLPFGTPPDGAAA
jgi:signal transduction histidine kinase